MAASVLGKTETFLERTNSYSSQVQTKHLFNALTSPKLTSSSPAESPTEKVMPNDIAITLVSTSPSPSPHHLTSLSSSSSSSTTHPEVKPELTSDSPTNSPTTLAPSSSNVITPLLNSHLQQAHQQLIFDENSSSSNSTTSSKSRKRKSEKEILEHDNQVFGVIVKHDEEPENCPDGEGKSATGNKTQSPAFRLRPRRACGSSTSANSSPFIMSPLKKISKKSVSSALESAKNLHAFLNTEPEAGGHCHKTPLFDMKSTIKVEKKSSEPSIVTSGPYKLNVPLMRSFDKSIIREMDVSVFAELISPLELKSGHVYSNNYTTLRVIDSKPIRTANLRVDSQDLSDIPVMELKVADVGERFTVEHSKGVFDSPEIKQASKNTLNVYLFGTYARRSAELLKSDDIMAIANFRTVPQKSSHNLRKRNSKGQDEDAESENTFVYPYSIVVDSLVDMKMISGSNKGSNNNEDVKEEQSDEEDLMVYDHELCQMFDQKFEVEEEEKALKSDKWAPFLSFSGQYRAPEDPKELNQSLYIFQPCVPKFESASSTVKM